MVPEKSVSTFVPFEVAGKTAQLAVNIIYPTKPRYKEGAPVVVIVPGEGLADGFKYSVHAAQSGFVEVRFSLPGTGRAGLMSAGSKDNYGAQSQQALRNVLLFAGGKLADQQGRSINSLVPLKLHNSSIGIVGWSQGGNLAAVTLGKYHAKLGFVGYAAFYESPLGAMFYPTNLGGVKDLIVNRHYRDGSCATGRCLVDYRKLRFDATGQKLPGYNKRIGQAEIRGVLFFDENNNNRWEESFEYALWYATEPGVYKQFYPPEILKALQRHKVLGADWPATVATLEESDAYFRERDGSLYIAEISQKLPNCLIGIYGNRVDHLQRQPDHGHIALQYNSWLANKARFVRLNPDPIYLLQVSSMNTHHFVDNPPNSSIDASEMEQHLEPAGLLPDYIYLQAFVSELSDRQKAGRLLDKLTAPLFAYTNDAQPAPAKPNDAAPAKPNATAAAKTNNAAPAKPNDVGAVKNNNAQPAPPKSK